MKCSTSPCGTSGPGCGQHSDRLPIGYSVRSSDEPRGMLDGNRTKSILKSSAAFDIPTAIDASLAACDTFTLFEARISLVGSLLPR